MNVNKGKKGQGALVMLGISIHDGLHLEGLLVAWVLELAVWLGLLLALEHLPVEEGGKTAAHKWTNPVDPVVEPHAGNNGWAERASWVHGATGDGDTDHDVDEDDTTDDEWSELAKVDWIDGNTHGGEDKGEGNKELAHPTIGWGDISSQVSVAKTSLVGVGDWVGWEDTLQESSTEDTTSHLGSKVHNHADSAELTNGPKADRDDWVEVSTADAPEHVNDCGGSKAVCKGHGKVSSQIETESIVGITG